MTARGAVFAAASILLAATPVRALSPEERELLRRSVRSSELKAFEAATGGLDALPSVAAEVEVSLEAQSVVGQVRLDWPNRTGRALDHVVLRLSSNAAGREAPFVDFTAVKVSVDGAPAVDGVLRVLNEHLTHVKLPSPLAPGKRVVISGALAARMADVSPGNEDPFTAGLGALIGGARKAPTGSQYGTFACGEGICTLTGFIPEIPAFLNGEFDLVEGSGIGDATFSEPVNAVLSVVAPAGVTVAATGLEVGRASAGDGQRRTTFVIAGARELGVVLSAEFVVLKTKVNDVTIRSFAKREDREGGRRALEAAKGALETFEAAFGKYPWTHLDLAESSLTGGAGGVELPALALGASGFYQQSNPVLAMVSTVTGGDMTGEMLDFITRHEVAHQWWHAQVGSHAQLHPWVDEPLAQWSALLATRKAGGAKAYERARKMQVVLNFQALPLMGAADGPAARAAGEFGSNQEYAGIVYGKAPIFYEAAAKQFGEATVNGALKALVQARRFRRATPEELVAALEKACGSGVRATWRHWMEEAHGEEDLGPLDLNGVTLDELPPGLFGPGGQGPAIDPRALKDAMKQLEELLEDFE